MSRPTKKGVYIIKVKGVEYPAFWNGKWWECELGCGGSDDLEWRDLTIEAAQKHKVKVDSLRDKLRG